jgi:hypothetical protein
MRRFLNTPQIIPEQFGRRKNLTALPWKNSSRDTAKDLFSTPVAYSERQQADHIRELVTTQVIPDCWIRSFLQLCLCKRAPFSAFALYSKLLSARRFALN